MRESNVDDIWEMVGALKRKMSALYRRNEMNDIVKWHTVAVAMAMVSISLSSPSS